MSCVALRFLSFWMQLITAIICAALCRAALHFVELRCALSSCTVLVTTSNPTWIISFIHTWAALVSFTMFSFSTRKLRIWVYLESPNSINWCTFDFCHMALCWERIAGEHDVESFCCHDIMTSWRRGYINITSFRSRGDCVLFLWDCSFLDALLPHR